MKYIFIFLCSAIFSCNQNDTNNKELELKEKELELKQKELDLKEKELSHDSLKNEAVKTANVSSAILGTYIVITEKTHFYTSPDLSTLRKAYLEKGDKLKILQFQGDFIYGNFTATTGTRTSGWLLSKDLEKILRKRYFNPH